MSDSASVNDGINFTKTSPVNEGCGIDPLVIACCNKEEFSGNRSYFNLACCSQASYVAFLLCHHDLDIPFMCIGFID